MSRGPEIKSKPESFHWCFSPFFSSTHQLAFFLIPSMTRLEITGTLASLMLCGRAMAWDNLNAFIVAPFPFIPLQQQPAPLGSWKRHETDNSYTHKNRGEIKALD